MSEFNLSDYLVSQKETGVSFPVVKRIYCNDGFNLSVQCNSASYCWPREDHSTFYLTVEVGFPSDKPELIMSYAEDPEKPTKTVYGYVPVELVQQLIESHGGIKNEKV